MRRDCIRWTMPPNSVLGFPNKYWFHGKSNFRSSASLTALDWFWLLSDLPAVLPLPQQLYLPRGMLGRIDCPTESNPPVYLTVWSKNERVIDLTQTTRFKVNVLGTLVIKTVSASDEGRYTCTPYSPLGPGQTSSPVQVLVRGKPCRTTFTWNISK